MLDAQSSLQESPVNIIQLYDQIETNPSKTLHLTDSLLTKDKNLTATEKCYLYHIASDCYYYLSDIRKSDESLVRAFDIMPENFPPSKHVEMLNSHGQNLDFLGKIDEAIDTYKKGLIIAHQQKDSIEISYLYYNLAVSNLSQSYFENALIFVDSAQQLSFKMKDSIGLASIMRIRASIYNQYEDYEKSIESLTSALPYTNKQEPELECIIFIDIANDYWHLDQIVPMKKYLDQAKACIQNNTYFNSQIEWYKAMGNYHLMNNDTLNAILFYDSTALTAQNAGDIHAYYHGLLSKFTLNNDDHNIERGIKAADKAYDLGMSRLASRAYYKLSQLLASKRRYSEAYEKLKLYKDLEERYIKEDNRKKMEALSIRYQLKEKDMQKQLAEEQLITDRLRYQSYIGIGITLFTLLLLFFLFKIYNDRIKAKQSQLENENRYLQELADIESQAFRAQMNPHFIFNAMNSIKGLIINNEAKEAALYISKFSKLIRKVLDNSRLKVISLKEELEVLELYINLEKKRFRDGFFYEINIDEKVDTELLAIPPVTLQTFVENAIWHGFKNNERENELKIQITDIGDDLQISIHDNGVGRNIKKIKDNKSSHGIEITQQRIHNFSGDDQQRIQYIDHKDKNGQGIGTTAILTIPKIEYHD